MTQPPPDSERDTPLMTADASTAGAAGESENLLELLLTANRLEQTGEIERARELYKDIVARDDSGVWGQSASQALAALPLEGSVDSTALGKAQSSTHEIPVSSSSVEIAQPERPPSSPKHLTSGSLGAKLKLLAIGAAIVPVALSTAAAVWLAPKTLPPQGDVSRSVDREMLLDRQTALILLFGGTSALLALGIALPLSHRLGQQIRSLAYFVKNVNLDRPLNPLDIPKRADEVGVLAEQLSELVDRVVTQTERLDRIEQQREREQQQSQYEKERLQQQALDLLERLEAARAGNLTVEAPLSAGEVGAIADAFNATIRSLRDFVAQTALVTAAVTDRTHDSEAAVRQLSEAARHQSEDLKTALATVRNIAEAIEGISHSTRDAAELARQATEAAQLGDSDMDRTVTSMERLRTNVANTAKKAKRLAESAQEVSQILSVVSGISEKANLLAFNASIEAARAGERGEGFRQVAEDVRGLAVQIGEAARDIERLVNSIQAETAEVLDVLESGTTEVVGSTRSISQTQQTLRQLTDLSQAIDRSLQAVASDSAERALASQNVNRVMDDVNHVALTNAEEAQRVVSVLQGLLDEVEALKSSMAKFQVESTRTNP
ncbi:MAG: hypothetical protein J7641_06750 [Cyanobacteria bacterium SID2]|nr:hypothetical protein [Cyanobacteria bacterium SID2]MBP0004704.1 hypothetical protein [Cyanobacteria bacterium SBC]